MPIPTYDNLFNPTLKALQELGGSASISELEEKVAEILLLPESDLNTPHSGGNKSEFGYRLAWARTYLKKYGLIENSARGVWALTIEGKKVQEVDKSEVIRRVREIINENTTIEEEIETGKDPSEVNLLWQEKLIDEILKLSPSEFEKICQRILRESDFIQVEVTGRSGDGGIDGQGVFQMGGLVSFKVAFQAKRYSGSVSSEIVRNFRGSIAGRADKGIIITTGTFTRDAKKEAVRDGTTIIDLIDGEQLAEKMKELRLGLKITQQEVVEVDKDWFKAF